MYVNPAVSLRSGYSKEELLRMNPLELLAEESKRKFQEIVIEAMKGEKTFFSAEFEIRSKNGQIVWGLFHAKVNFKNGKPDSVQVFVQDITERKKAEVALKKSEERLQNIINSIDDGIVLIGLDGKVIDCNQATLKQLNLKRDEVTGKVIMDFMFSKNQEDIIKETQDLLQKTGKAIVETQLKGKNDSPLSVEVSLTRFYDQNRRPTGLLGVARDITERKKIQDGLKESEERFRALVESTSDMIWQVDEKAVYTYISPKVKDILGYEPNEIVGKTPFDLIDEKDEEKILNSFLEIANKKEPFYGLENWNVHKNGSRVLLETSGVPILDKKGQLLGYRGIDRDITERKKTEEALANAQVTLKRQLDEIRFYYDVAPVGLSVFDTNLRFVKINKRMAEINGIPPEYHVGKSIAEIVPSVAEPLEKLLKQIITSGNPIQDIEITGEAANMPGVKRTLLESLMPMKDNNGFVIGVNVVAQEITEQKNMQAKLKEYSKNLEKLVEQRTKQLQDKERLAAIGATAGMVGHDIRNPLQAIVSDVYLLKDELSAMPEVGAKANVTESLDSIEKNIGYINKIVADLQDYARPITPVTRETELEQICQEILTKDVPTNIKATCKIEKTVKQVTADPELLKRIITNLVTNAIQAMPKGGKLSVYAYRKENNVIIEVQDTGEGIPEEVKPKLFTPLFTTKSKGQGFGLAVVKRVTESMNGTVTFESEKGKGTKFTICLPPQRAKQ